jgi:hypothetical protein
MPDQVSGKRTSQIPQEAVIGISYVLPRAEFQREFQGCRQSAALALTR